MGENGQWYLFHFSYVIMEKKLNDATIQIKFKYREFWSPLIFYIDFLVNSITLYQNSKDVDPLQKPTDSSGLWLESLEKRG